MTLAQLRADGVPAATLAQMRLLLDQAFTTENEFVTRVAEVVKPEELAAHRSAIVRRAAPPNTPGKTDGGGLEPTLLFAPCVGRAHYCEPVLSVSVPGASRNAPS